MKKIMAIACLLLLVVVAGCIKVQDSDIQQGAGEEADVGVQETVQDAGMKEEPKTAGYALKAETRALVESQLQKGSDVVFPQNFQKLSYGGSYVFGIGVNNMQTYEDEFQVQVNFDKAYDKYMNTIDADEAAMNSWVKTVFQPFLLESYKNDVMGLAVEVGDRSPGVKPTAGTYVFDVQVYHRVAPGAGLINTPYGAKSQFSIKVE